MVKLPDGAVVRLLALCPQQVIAPALFRAQLCAPNALTAVKVPVSVEVSIRPLALLPQQSIVPVLRSAQVWEPPALTAV